MDGKLILTGEKYEDIEMDLPNVRISSYVPVVESLDEEYHNMIIRKPGGDKITLVTSNMPPQLRAQVAQIIQKYCNH